MSQVRVLGMTEDEFIESMKSAGMPSAQKIVGVSRTVVKSVDEAQVATNSNSTVVFMIGDGSFSMNPYRETFVEGYNDYMRDAMLESAVPGSILLSTAFFHDNNYKLDPSDPDFQEPLEFLHAPLVLDLTPKMTKSDFDTEKWYSETPLTDAIASVISASVAYSEKMLAKGKSVRVIIIVFSDGLNNASRKVLTPEDLAPDMLRLRELGNFTQVFIGFGANKQAFVNYAKRAGFPDGNVKVVPDNGNREEAKRELRRILDLVSRQTVNASKGMSDPNQFFT